MKKYNLKNDTMNKSELQRVYNYPINPRDSKIYTDKCFVNIGDGSQGRKNWTCFIMQDNKSFYFDRFGFQPQKLYINKYLHQKLIINIKYKI